MVLGYLLVNYTSLADRKLTKQANAIVFKIFLPCMLFYNVYQSDIGAEIHSRIKLCIWAAGGLLILFVLLCLIVPKVVKQENQQGVVIQGIFRSNYVIFGVAVVQNMYGVKSTTTAAILSAILVPMYNFLAVVALSIFGEKRETDWKKIILDIGNQTSDGSGYNGSGSGKAVNADCIHDPGRRSGLLKSERKLKSCIGSTDDQACDLTTYYDPDDRYDGIQGCGSVVRPAGIPDSGCGIQLYHGTTGRSGWTACRTAGGVLIGAFDLYVVCDDIDIADDRIAWDLIY